MSSLTRKMHELSCTIMIGTVVWFTMLPANSQNPAARPLVTSEQYERWKVELSNWNRWGKDDGLGALILITPAIRKQAASLVRDGMSISLASTAFVSKEVDIPCPAECARLAPNSSGSTDRIGYPCRRGGGGTHLDAFAHRLFDEKMWNGHPVQGSVSMVGGARKNSVLTMRNGMVTRAVLQDIPRLKGVPYWEPGERFFPEDFEAWEKKTGVRVGPGDALLLRWERRANVGPWADDSAAGFENSVIPWLKKRDVALLGWESPGYLPQPGADLSRRALHDLA